MNHISDELVIIFLWFGITKIFEISMLYFKMPLYYSLIFYIILVIWMVSLYHNRYTKLNNSIDL